MSAQPGNAVTLGYGPQGAQQAGATVVLSYSAPPAASRRIAGGWSAHWVAATPQRTDLTAPMERTAPLDTEARAPWRQAQARQRERRHGWAVADRKDAARGALWGRYSRTPQIEPRAPWAVAARLDRNASAPWGSFARHIALEPLFPWGVASRADQMRAALWGEFASHLARTATQAWANHRTADATRWLPWLHFSRPLDAGWGVVVPPGGIGPDEPAVIVPIRRAYIVLNNITLHRVDTGAELNAHGFSMSLDYQSWTWSWSASLHHDAAAHLDRDSQGDPAELAVVVNGVQFRLRLERIGRDRRFSPTRWSVSGRGKAAVLDAPYAPSLSFGSASARTAQQLMVDALTINGVGIGWSVDWGLTDWLVPGGAWALQGSYIEAVNDIASAAGGYVQPHPTDAVLRILPRYPAAPWNWAGITPDFEIPADAAEVEGTEYIDRPAYNRVFVGGVGAGVFGPFTRAGTAGNVIAPQATHPLITHADAHRQRGLAELSDTGRQEHITLKMQVLPEIGVITPGQFVRYLGEKTVIGIVRSTSIDWSRPVLRQTIGIETHA